MSTPIEHNEPVKTPKPEDIGAAAGARLGAEAAASMNSPKAESAGPNTADKHLTNLQLTDSNGKPVSNKPSEQDSPPPPSNGEKPNPPAAQGHGDKTVYGGPAGNPGHSPDTHFRNEAQNNDGKLALAAAVAGGAVVTEGALIAGLGPLLAIGAGAATGYEVNQAFQHHR